MNERGAIATEGGGFDYGALDERLRHEIIDERDQIHQRMRRSAEDIIAIGTSLIRVKERLPHGQWGPWLTAEFGWSNQTALNFMSVARAFPEIPNGLEFAPKALYALASGNVPQAVRFQFIEQAERGERVTYQQVRKELSPPPEPTTIRVRTELSPPPEPTTTGSPDLDENGTLPVVDLDTGEIVHAAPVADRAVQNQGMAEGVAKQVRVTAMYVRDSLRLREGGANQRSTPTDEEVRAWRQVCSDAAGIIAAVTHRFPNTGDDAE